MGTRKPKAEAAEVARRIDAILNIRLDGAEYSDVCQYAAENGWGDISERQLRRYIAAADDLLIERQEKKRKRLIARHIAQRQRLFARAVNAADLRTALAVIDSLAKIQGLNADAKELKELAKLATTMTTRVAELERQLADTRRNQEPTEAGVAPAGPH